MFKQGLLDNTTRLVMSAEPLFRDHLATKIRWQQEEPLQSGYFYVRSSAAPEDVRTVFLVLDDEVPGQLAHTLDIAFPCGGTIEFLGPFEPKDLVIFAAHLIAVERWTQAGKEADRVLREVG